MAGKPYASIVVAQFLQGWFLIERSGFLPEVYVQFCIRLRCRNLEYLKQHASMAVMLKLMFKVMVNALHR
jgi:hypothetical protein